MTTPGEDAARALLTPRETLREWGDVGIAFGDTGPVSEWQPVELKSPGWWERAWAFCTRTTLRRVVFFTLFAPVALILAIDSIGPSTLVDRLIGGRTCEGPRSSIARRVQHAMSALEPGADHLVVSDRRVLLARRELFADPPQLTLVLSVPLRDIASARHRPHGPLRRRVELHFIDGTRIILALPLLRSPGPERLLAALAH